MEISYAPGENLPAKRNGSYSILSVNSEFETFDSLFVVRSVSGNNVSCKVVEADSKNLDYNINWVHSFSIAFVTLKINEYLS